jgi:hypothetical protein
VVAYDPLHDLESQPRAFADRLGGEKRIEDTALHLGRNTGTTIADLDKNPARFYAGLYR